MTFFMKNLAILTFLTLPQNSMTAMEIERSAMGSPSADLKLSPYGQNCLFGYDLWLRPVFPQDWESVAPLFTNKESMKNFASGRTYSPEEIQKSTAEKARKILSSTPEIDYCWSIISHDGIVGRIYTWEAKEDLGHMEVAYAISPQFNGRSFATKAAQLVLDAVNKPFMATAHPDNIGSQIVLQRLGFTRDLSRQNIPKFGQARDYFLFQPKKQQRSGDYMSRIFFSLLENIKK